MNAATAAERHDVVCAYFLLVKYTGRNAIVHRPVADRRQ